MKYIASCSFGKDSLAMLLKILELGLPLDEVVYCDIRFDEKSLSGETPEMAAWIPQAEKILKDKFNVTVKRISSKWTFKSHFYRVKRKGNHIGDNYGFPYVVGAWCNSRLKLEPMNKYIKQILKSGESVTEYIGIAKDEPKRLERYKKLETEKHKYVTLSDFNITELEAMEICKQHGLLSPIYQSSFRGGCWFCPKQSHAQLKWLYLNHPELWQLLKEMEKDSHNTFKPNISIFDLEEKFKKEVQNGKRN